GVPGVGPTVMVPVGARVTWRSVEKVRPPRLPCGAGARRVMVKAVTLPEFANPWGLLLLPAAPLAAWRWLRRRRPALRFPGARALAELPAGRARRVRVTGALLRGLGFFALVLALAGPRWPDPGTRLPAEGIAIEFVLDVSGSMAEPDFDWHGQPLRRLDAVKRAFR